MTPGPRKRSMEYLVIRWHKDITVYQSYDCLHQLLQDLSTMTQYAFDLPVILALLKVLTHSPITERSLGISGIPHAQPVAALCTGCCGRRKRSATADVLAALAESLR
jgi:hypothetical protein